MGMSAAHYLTQLQALLPQGIAWTREPDTNLTGLLSALAEELARVDGRVAALLEEADPRTAYEPLIDWERVAGLPDSCTTAADTTAERRAVLHAKLTNIGGQSRQFFIDLAASLGYVITISELQPFVAGSQAGDVTSSDTWHHAWQVNAPRNHHHPTDSGRGGW
ncbi:YmfQ family protein [Candidatus Vondammii sp. HM_W22]|uniref:YmfQ family protein n=1 Tax=Candidatus Vondammii sp. HM_W22 TaxID=2687299 RepID=UPI001F135B88|nr:putative phage tail protein [Candidatus Vondammii sp. HM_W22]